MRTKKTFKEIIIIVFCLFAALAFLSAASAIGQSVGGAGLELPEINIPGLDFSDVPGLSPACEHNATEVVCEPYKRLLETQKTICTKCDEVLGEEIVLHSWCLYKDGTFTGAGIDPCENCFYIMESGDLLYCECSAPEIRSYMVKDYYTHQDAQTRDFCLNCGKLAKAQ